MVMYHRSQIYHLNILMKRINYFEVLSIDQYAWEFYNLLRLNPNSPLLTLRLKIQSHKILERLFHAEIKKVCTKQKNYLVKPLILSACHDFEEY